MRHLLAEKSKNAYYASLHLRASHLNACSNSHRYFQHYGKIQKNHVKEEIFAKIFSEGREKESFWKENPHQK